MSAFATTPATATATIGDITSYLDQENLYNPLNVLKAEAKEVYGKMVTVIKERFSKFFLPGTVSGKEATTADQLASIKNALASKDIVGTGTQRFLELKMIIQLYADLLHQIAEGTLSSSDQTIANIKGYAKGLADLFDNWVTRGINEIKKLKGFAPGNYRYLKKALFPADPVINPDDLDLTELHDSVVPLVIFNVLNEIKNDSIFWDTGEFLPAEQRSYLLECMKAVEIKLAINRRELPNAPIKYIADMTDRIHAKSGEMTREALQKPDGLIFIEKIEEIISEKRDELKSLDDDKNMDIERDDGAGDDGDDDDYIIQAHYYKPGEFFHNILGEIFKSVGKDVPPNLIAIANELDAKIVKSVPDDDKDKVIPMTREVKVGAFGEATPTTEMDSTHPYRGVSLRAVKARGLLKTVLRIAIFKSIPAHTQTKIPSDIERLSTRIKSKRTDILLDFDITGMQLDILIGWQREGLIKPMPVSKMFFSDIDVLFNNFKKDDNIETLMLLFRRIQVAIKDDGAILPKTARDILSTLRKRVTKQQPGLDSDKIKLMKRIIKELTSFIQNVTDLETARRRSRREDLIAASGARGGGGKRNTKKQKKNQKKKTMKAPHKRTIKKRKRRKNKTSNNRS
jgi:hypothetical protein